MREKNRKTDGGHQQYSIFANQLQTAPSWSADLKKMRLVLFVSVLGVLGPVAWAAKELKGPKVTLEQGTLVGKTLNSRLGSKIFAFQGIPYAAPPVGQLRFKAPEGAPSWTGERSAQREGSDCTQRHFLVPQFLGSEDCLYLNVYSPKIDAAEGLPVMVWVHGGGFSAGSGSTELYGPEFLLDKNVILVTINYRVGMLGFLNLGTPEAPGNYGMKDQVAALRWVKKNIAAFGGNPDSVTIFGESAGGASIHYLLISPLAKGLYHRAIIQSGSALNQWAYLPESPRVGLESSANLGCDQENLSDLIACLRKVEAQKFSQEGMDVKERERRLVEFAPSVEPEGTIDPFLPRHPRDMPLADVPLIAGITTHEGMLHIIKMKPLNVAKEFDENRDKYVMQDLGLEKYSPQWTKTWDKIKNFYKSLQGDELEQYLLLATDVDFAVGVDQMLRSTVVSSERKNPFYLYQFSHDGSLTLFKKMAQINRPGTCHADELGYLFTPSMMQAWKKAPPRDKAAIEKITTLWTNFAKTGNPTPDEALGVTWSPVQKTSDDPDSLLTHFLDINDNLQMKEQSLNQERMSFWSQIYQESKKLRKEEL